MVGTKMNLMLWYHLHLTWEALTRLPPMAQEAKKLLQKKCYFIIKQAEMNWKA